MAEQDTASKTDGEHVFEPLVAVVDFHHARGPEVERWIGVEEGRDPAAENDWGLLPFLALSDGAHLSVEDFSYFTLVQKAMPQSNTDAGAPLPRSLFGMSCTRQLDSSELKERPKDVTRSTVQKAVVLITDTPHAFAAAREKLSAVTKAWFLQKDFTDIEILQSFRDSLRLHGLEEDTEYIFGLSLREIVRTFKWQTLVLLKGLLLQPKMLFFGTHCERTCLMQFSLISLIPGLMRKLVDCADPVMDTYAQTVVRPTSLRTSDRSSLLSYMGLPLQIFGKGSFFGPYTPLQQLDILADQETKSYVVGSTNSLLLQQRDHYADVLVNMDDNTVGIFSPSLKSALGLSAADRRWIDFLTQTVNDTWDEENPERPKNLGYAGSEEFIRLQFEEYLLALLSSVKYHEYIYSHKDENKALLSEVEGDPAAEFSSDFVTRWQSTENYALFNRCTDSHLFDVIEPRHPCAGGLTIDDVQRRLSQQVQELHLDERWRDGRETLGKHLAEGQKKVSGAMASIWADIEVMREAQRKKAEEQQLKARIGELPSSSPTRSSKFQKPDFTQAQASVQAASSRAGAYLSSWGSWAAEKRKKGWGSQPSNEIPDSRPAVTTVSELAKEDVRDTSTKVDEKDLKKSSEGKRSGEETKQGETEVKQTDEEAVKQKDEVVFKQDEGEDTTKEEEDKSAGSEETKIERTA